MIQLVAIFNANALEMCKDHKSYEMVCMTRDVEEHKRRGILVWKKRVVSELLSPGKGNSTDARSLQEAILKRFQCFGDTETFSSGGEN